MSIMGIYKITNIINDKFYIGSSKNIPHRWRQHQYELDNNKHVNSYLQNAWNKYGKENFKFEIIEAINDKEVLLDREQIWLDKTKCYNPTIGYNLSACTKGVYIDFAIERERVISKEKQDTKLYCIKNKNVYNTEGNLISTISNLNGLIMSLYIFYKNIICDDELFMINAVLSNCILYSQELNFSMQNIIESKTDINDFLERYSIEMIRIENYCHCTEYVNIYKNSFVLYKINRNKLILQNHYRTDEINLYVNM